MASEASSLKKIVGEFAQSPPRTIQNVLQQEHVTITFGTPVSNYLWPDSDAINAALSDVILQKEKADRGITRSNVGGWHSQTDLFNWDLDCVRTLKDRVTSCALDMTRLMTTEVGQRKINLQMECWANVSRRGQYNSVHDHAGTTWSGVYYVSGGKPDNDDPLNGKLELIDPRLGAKLFDGAEKGFFGRCFVRPVPGLMVIFPSWLKHMVHPFVGSGERISVSFNVHVRFPR
jgi:uncharacterized protein (TIGR02466 family)